MMRDFSFAALLAFLQCGAPSQQEVVYPLVARGVSSGPFTSRGSWDVTLTDARVALGPIYFCTTEAASPDFCEVAQAEFASSANFNALTGDEQLLGEVRGLTGTIGSAQYDFGISWTTTQNNPTATSGSLNGHSAHFEGIAQRADKTVRFVLELDLPPRDQGSRTVQGGRAGADIADARVNLLVSVDPVAWWRHVDFSEIENNPESVVQIDGDSVIANTVIIGMTANETPVFEWRAQ